MLYRRRGYTIDGDENRIWRSCAGRELEEGRWALYTTGLHLLSVAAWRPWRAEQRQISCLHPLSVSGGCHSSILRSDGWWTSERHQDNLRVDVHGPHLIQVSMDRVVGDASAAKGQREDEGGSG